MGISTRVSTTSLWIGRIVGGILSALLFVDAIGKLLRVPEVVEGTAQLGYPETLVLVIGIIEAVCVSLYVTPRTNILGAILLTGYLGGATATHVRIGSPLFTHILAPVIVGVLIWAALFLRDVRLRALIPFVG